METIRALILRLQQQSDQHADNAELLVTVQQLEAAINGAMTEPVRQVRSGNISVVFPSGNRIHSAPPQREQVAPEPQKVALKEVEPAPVDPGIARWAPKSTPADSEQVRWAPEPKPIEPEPISVAESFHLNFEKEDEAKKQPASQQMEMNDIFGQSSSLNDRMRGDQQEIGSVLNEEPVKDLRRAIGINDRFVYLSELFRGDEVMYERSLKTINNFRIYPEAEYWIERELKVKLGWDESKETVKQFRQLVRRRFQT